MIGNIIELVVNIVQMFIWTWFITAFFGYKKSSYKIGFFVTWIVITSEITFINRIIPYDGILTGILTVTLVIYAKICLKGRTYFHIFISLFSTAIIFSIGGLATLSLSFFSGFGINAMLTNFTLWRGIGVISCRIFEYIIFRAVILIKDEYQLTNREWILFITMPLLTWLSVVLMMNAAIVSAAVQLYVFCMTLIIVLIDFLIYYFMIKIKQDARAATELEVMKMQYNNIKTTETNMKALYDSTYSVKHDLEKHFLAIKTMAEKDKNNDIVDYACKILKCSQESAQKILFTDNGVFNSIINTRIEICKQKEIFPSISVSNEAIGYIRTEDMVVLFGNIFDNAIEAAELSNEKIIILNVQLQGEYVSVCMENSFNRDFSGVVNETTKADKREHGYGLKNVRKIVEKYDGMLQCAEEENNMFCCDILLKKQNGITKFDKNNAKLDKVL